MYTTVFFESGNGKECSADIEINGENLSFEIESISISGSKFYTRGMQWKRIYKLQQIIERYCDLRSHFCSEKEERNLDYGLSFNY